MSFYPKTRSQYVNKYLQKVAKGRAPLPLTKSGTRSELLNENKSLVITTTGRLIAVPLCFTRQLLVKVVKV